MLDILLDALLDTMKLIPFLYLVYMLINYCEQNTNNGIYHKLTHAKWGGPIVGALMGCVPQCGFSVIGANLYSRKIIGLGTLIAIFISTSDEAIPILIAHPHKLDTVAMVLILKVGIAILIGCGIEAISYLTKSKRITASSNGTVFLQDEEIGNICSSTDACSCHAHHDHHNIFVVTLIHTLRISLFILAVNFMLNFIIESVGEGVLESILLTNNILQPALAALIGLIPNCAASIVLTEMFIAGTLSLGALIAGLSTGAGIGLIMLFKENKSLKENLKILALLYSAGTVCGLFIQLF